jgi:ubiquinone/menaquinone biosynthesis C-methylase UbiE
MWFGHCHSRHAGDDRERRPLRVKRSKTAGVSNETWSDIAGWYDALVEAGSGPHETALQCLLGLVPGMDGQAVLDVGCGQGFATRAVAEAGAARVVGTDSSEAMIGHARGHGGEATYVVDDAQRLARFGDREFDGVTCQLALMDIPDLDATLAAVRRVLRDGGWFVFVIGHPCFLVPDALPAQAADGRPAVTVTGYFDERFWRSKNPNGVRRVGNHHRTLTTYLNSLVRHGFALEEVAEPRTENHVPLYAEVPIFFAARVRAERR